MVGLHNAGLTLLREAEFNCHAARCSAPTPARGRVRRVAAISTLRHNPSAVLPTAKIRYN